MPMEGVHAARQMNPDRCDSIRQKEVAPGVSFNYCIRGGKAGDVQSVHFDANRFTPDEARAWLKRNNMSAAEFEPAKGSEAKAAAVVDLPCEMVDPKDCPEGMDCPMRKTKQAMDDAETAPPMPDMPDMPEAGAGPLEIRASATGTCEIEAAAGDAGALPRVNMLAYTGVPMKLDGFHLPVVVDLETLKVPRQRVPILRSHDADRIAGHSDKIDVTPQRLKASGVLSGAPRQTVDVVHLGKNGFPWQVSIGAQTTDRVQHVPAGETVKVNGRVWKGPLLVARNAVLRELSLLPMGADGNTEAGLSAEAPTDLRAAVCDLLAYDPTDTAEVDGLLADLRAYDPDQPRDDHGRFGEGGGGAGGGDKGETGGGAAAAGANRASASAEKATDKAIQKWTHENRQAAERAHSNAAKAHREAARKLVDEKKPDQAFKHEKQADAHSRAAGHFATDSRPPANHKILYAVTAGAATSIEADHGTETPEGA